MKKIAVMAGPTDRSVSSSEIPLGNKSKAGRVILKIIYNFICRIFTAGVHRGP